jgi:type VI secretion system protein ImpK
MQQEKLMKSLIIKDFRSFYEEVVRLKAKALMGDILVDIKAEGESSATVDPSTLCREIQRTLLSFFKEHRDYIERYGGEFALQYYHEAQYIMVALADEVFLTLNWIGREEWKNSLLEAQLFHTQVAGEKFFENLEAFLKVRESSNSDIGVLYIFALGLGFKGKYQDTDDKGALKHYRDQLQARVMEGSPFAVKGLRKFFPEAYSHTLETREGLTLPTARRWAMILGGIVLAYLIVSYIIWITNIHGIDEVVDQIRLWVRAQ